METLLNEDVRNNSAWNHRYFIINNHQGWSDYNVQREICYVIEKKMFIKNNESSWNYLRGVLLHDKRGLSGNAVVTSFCEDLYRTKCKSPYFLAFLVDIIDEAIKKGEVSSLHSPERAIDICQLLATKHDKIRSKYWNYISDKFKKIKQQLDEKKKEEEEDEDLGFGL